MTFLRWPSATVTFKSLRHCPLNVDDLITLRFNDEAIDCLRNETLPWNFPGTANENSNFQRIWKWKREESDGLSIPEM